jgi:hypothetical protein
MILMTPLAIPRIEPKDWDEWWNVWNKYSGLVTKDNENHNNSVGSWRGMNLYTNSVLKNKTIYSAPTAPRCPLTDDIVNQIRNSIPIVPVVVRVIENLDTVPAHSDHAEPKDELRCMLWNTYTEPVWEFKYMGEQKALVLPDTTNSFYYKDYPMTHASKYIPGFSKGILIVYGIFKPEFTKFIENSSTTFKDYAWVV